MSRPKLKRSRARKGADSSGTLKFMKNRDFPPNIDFSESGFSTERVLGNAVTPSAAARTLVGCAWYTLGPPAAPERSSPQASFIDSSLQLSKDLLSVRQTSISLSKP
jgi:hypothetical protein